MGFNIFGKKEELELDIDVTTIDGVIETLEKAIDLALSEEGIQKFTSVNNLVEDELSGEAKEALVQINEVLGNLYQNDIDSLIMFKDVMVKYREFLENGPTGVLKRTENLIQLSPNAMQTNFDEFSGILNERVLIVKGSSLTTERALNQRNLLEAEIEVKENAEPPQDTTEERRKLSNLNANESLFNNMKSNEDAKIDDIKRRFEALQDPITVFKSEIALYPYVWQHYVSQELGIVDTSIADYIDNHGTKLLLEEFLSLSNLTEEEFLEQLSDRLKIDKEEITNKLKDLEKEGLLDNFLENCLKQMSMMGIDAFLSDPERIKWLANNPGFEAYVLRVNGEIVVLFPGSQELKEDWWETDLKPNLLHQVPEQYQIAADLVAQVKAEYPDDNIVLCGYSLAGGSVFYAGAVNDVNAFAIDPAPSKEGEINSDYDKILTAIPGGKSDGILNEPVTDSDGYYKSNTDIDIADGLAIGLSNDVTRSMIGSKVGGTFTDDSLVGEVVGSVGGSVISSPITGMGLGVLSE